MKSFFIGFIKFIFKEYLMNIPFNTIRVFFLRKIVIRSIGNNTFIGKGVDIRGTSKNIDIGSNCVINKTIVLDSRYGSIKIGNNVDIGQETNIWTTEHDPNDDTHAVKGGDVIIEDYVWISTRVTVLPGVRIGKGAVVACNSVVTKNVNPMEIVGGVPAKKIGMRQNRLIYVLKYNPWFG